MTPEQLDAIHALLADARRRYVLYHFLKNQRGSAEELAPQIAAWERGVSVDEVDQSAVDRVSVALVHNHLPRLADHGIVDYDARSGDVVPAEAFERARPFIEHAFDFERRTRTTEEFIHSQNNGSSRTT
ncbi:hypothetical protein ACFQGT_03555 [Natrialbaceae archaeon GCM10025810]|uniref:DUF7344 domain-containing protein n=1 Tax=Halovalidus salilacus TaxID=3075124 RepID=UPI0036199128